MDSTVDSATTKQRPAAHPDRKPIIADLSQSHRAHREGKDIQLVFLKKTKNLFSFDFPLRNQPPLRASVPSSEAGENQIKWTSTVIMDSTVDSATTKQRPAVQIKVSEFPYEALNSYKWDVFS